MENEEVKTESGLKKWGKRAGVAGFLFFLIKGLIWIAIAVMAYFSATK